MYSLEVHLILHFVNYVFLSFFAGTVFYYLNKNKCNSLNSHQNHKPQALQLKDHEGCNQRP